MFLTMDLGKALDWVILSSAVILVYDWTAKPDPIASAPSSHFSVTPTSDRTVFPGWSFRQPKSANYFLRFLLLLVVQKTKKYLQEIN